MVLVSNRRHNFGRVNMYFIVPSLLTINLRKEDLLCHFDSRMTFRVSSNAHITEEFVSHMQAKMSPTHQEFKKTEQVVGRPRTTDHNIMDDYVKDPPNNLSPESLKNAEAAIQDSQAYEDRLNDDKHERRYRADTKKHTGGRLGALGDAEEGGVPQFEDRQDREADGTVDRAGVAIRGESQMGRPVRF
ncbi:hypothetical protein EV361DRAFT_372122 [Lentinula raphanica]|nr:hypothetical protein EV361DRAFT_372122 [Lentinula raphanica]